MLFRTFVLIAMIMTAAAVFVSPEKWGQPAKAASTIKAMAAPLADLPSPIELVADGLRALDVVPSHFGARIIHVPEGMMASRERLLARRDMHAAALAETKDAKKEPRRVLPPAKTAATRNAVPSVPHVPVPDSTVASGTIRQVIPQGMPAPLSTMAANGADDTDGVRPATDVHDGPSPIRPLYHRDSLRRRADASPPSGITKD